MIFQGYLFSILYAVVVLFIGFVLYKLRCPKTVTRKIVHILVGFEWIILYHFFCGGTHFLAVCLLFLGLLILSHRKKLFPMIESDSDNSPGTVYYAVAMSVMALITLFLPDMIVPFGIGVFCTSLGDGFAGLLGQLITSPKNGKIYGSKTIYGTMYNFFICFIVAGVFNGKFNLGMEFWQVFAIALFAAELELFTGKGLDNISVTLGAAFLCYLFINSAGIGNYIIPILITPIMIAITYKKKALSKEGIIAAIVVDVLISVSLGNFGFVTLLAFFIGGIITDKIKNKYKNKGRNKKQRIKSDLDLRNHRQVLANSLVATVCAVCYMLFGQDLFVIAFVASLAEALADTAASGIGVLCGKAYDPFRRRPCAPGISGGMSLPGTGASAIAAVLIVLLARAFNVISLPSAIIIAISAILGGVFDSLLGSLLQVKFKCPICAAVTEKAEHCSSPTVHHSGVPFITNDTVNLLGTLFSAILSIALYFLYILM